MKIAVATGLAILGCCASGASGSPNDTLTPDWCATMKVWEGRGFDRDGVTEGLCPTEGPCDDPFVRNGFTVVQGTLFRTIRAHLLVFRESDGTNPAATEGDIIAQMADLNADLEPHRLRVVWTWEYIDDSNYRNLGFGGVSAMKSAYATDTDIQCNMYITGFGGGVGTFPWDPNALATQGGLVTGSDFFGAGFHVLTHELGHTIGLWHTHHGVDEVGLCSECYESPGFQNDFVGDFCGDVPPRPADFGLCAPPGTIDPCTGTPWGNTQPENYMSYGSGDGASCWTKFTPNQAARMHCWIEDVLSSWEPCGNGQDCNGNLIDDDCDIAEGTSLDDNGDGVPDECDAGIPGDLDEDGDVDVKDLLMLLSQWGPCGACAADIDNDGDVDIEDLLTLLANWG